jgi:hypothetical protein
MEAVPAKTEKAKVSKREDSVFFAPSVRANPDKVKLIRTFLGWRYGLTQMAVSIQHASVVVGKVDVDTDAVVLPDTNLRELRIVADEKLKIVNEKPTIYAPLIEPFVRRQLETMAVVGDDSMLELHLKSHPHASSIFQKRSIEHNIKEAILAGINGAQYVVVDESMGSLHIAVAAIAASMGKYVVAVCSSPVMAAFADYPIARMEDIVAAVAAVIGHELMTYAGQTWQSRQTVETRRRLRSL